jgi:hypothetical protein
MGTQRWNTLHPASRKIMVPKIFYNFFWCILGAFGSTFLKVPGDRYLRANKWEGGRPLQPRVPYLTSL